MKHIARAILRLISRLILWRQKPLVVGVAGSMGKTSVKEAIALAIHSSQRSVRKTEGNFNAEIGVPATIMASGGRPKSVAGWLKLLLIGIAKIFGGSYPQALVLEMAADHPGDLIPLIKLTRPKIGVLTSVAPEHLEYFGSIDRVVAEESQIVRALSKTDRAVVNIDDPRIGDLLSKIVAPVTTYGWSEQAMVRVAGLTLTRDQKGMPDGMVVKVAVHGSIVPIALPNVIGRHQVYPVLAAVAVGQAIGDDAVTIGQRLNGFQPPAGRMRLFRGSQDSLIIDDSYNAAPEAMTAAIETLVELELPGQKLAILGQMSELGAAAADWHDKIGQLLAAKKIDGLITVGPLAKRISEAAIKDGMAPAQVKNVETAEAAAAAIQPWLTTTATILVKGSRYAAHLERAVAMLLADPEADKKFLVTSH